MTDRPIFTTIGKVVLRNGEPFARGQSEAIALALASALDGAQLLFGPDTPIDEQDFVARTLWPAAQRTHQPLEPMLSRAWED